VIFRGGGEVVYMQTNTKKKKHFSVSKFHLYFLEKTESVPYVKSIISKEPKDMDNHFCCVVGCTETDTA